MSKNRTASFGGVAALFGDEEEEEEELAPQVSQTTSASGGGRRQASFGGVASLFGEEDDEEEDNGPAPAQSKPNRGAKPSFGGVSTLFSTDEDEEPAPKPSGGGRRQASFGGVAALFGEDDEEEDEDLGGAPPSNLSQNNSAPSKPSKKRDPSFSGVAALFGDSDEEEPDEPEQYGNALGGDGLGELAQLPKANINKPKKRDPSFGGVADLFGGDDDIEEDENSEDYGFQQDNITYQQQTEEHNQIVHELRIELEQYKERVEILEEDLADARLTNDELQKQIEDLKEERKLLMESKFNLIATTAGEIERMRLVMGEIQRAAIQSTEGQEQQQAQTVG